jgi:hypothetical protein
MWLRNKCPHLFMYSNSNEFCLLPGDGITATVTGIGKLLVSEYDHPIYMTL